MAKKLQGFQVWVPGHTHGVVGDELDEGVGDEEGGEAEGSVLEESETVPPGDNAEAEDDGGDLSGAAVAEAPKNAGDLKW